MPGQFRLHHISIVDFVAKLRQGVQLRQGKYVLLLPQVSNLCLSFMLLYAFTLINLNKRSIMWCFVTTEVTPNKGYDALGIPSHQFLLTICRSVQLARSIMMSIQLRVTFYVSILALKMSISGTYSLISIRPVSILCGSKNCAQLTSVRTWQVYFRGNKFQKKGARQEMIEKRLYDRFRCCVIISFPSN